MEAIDMRIAADEATVEQRTGLAIDRVEGQWLVEIGGSRRFADVATSCLLEPAADDRVLVLSAGPDCWILAVLERNSDATAWLRFSGDVGIECDGGGLSVHSQRAMNLSSAESVRIASPAYTLCANAAEHFVHGVTWVGRKLVSTFDSIRTVGRNVETVSDSRRDHSRHSIRSVEQVDRVTSGQIDYQARGNFTIRGRHVVAKGRELAKVDAKQIQLG